MRIFGTMGMALLLLGCQHYGSNKASSKNNSAVSDSRNAELNLVGEPSSVLTNCPSSDYLETNPATGSSFMRYRVLEWNYSTFCSSHPMGTPVLLILSTNSVTQTTQCAKVNCSDLANASNYPSNAYCSYQDDPAFDDQTSSGSTTTSSDSTTTSGTTTVNTTDGTTNTLTGGTTTTTTTTTDSTTTSLSPIQDQQTTTSVVETISPINLTPPRCGPEIGKALIAGLYKLEDTIKYWKANSWLTYHDICDNPWRYATLADFDTYTNSCINENTPCERCVMINGRPQERGFVNYALMGRLMRLCGMSHDNGAGYVTLWKTCWGQKKLLKRPDLWYWFDFGFYGVGSQGDILGDKQPIDWPVHVKFLEKCPKCDDTKVIPILDSPMFRKWPIPNTILTPIPPP